MLWQKKSKFNFAEAYFNTASEEVKKAYEHLPPVKKRRSRLKLIKAVKIASYAVIAIFIFFVIAAITFAVALKDSYSSIIAGKDNIDNAIYFAKIKDFGESLDYAEWARNDFDAAYESFAAVKNTFVAKNIPFINSQFDNADYLLYTASLLADSMRQSIEFMDKLDRLMNSKGISFSQLSKDDKRAVLAYIYESSGELVSLKDKLDRAQENIDKARFPALINFVNVKISKMGEQIGQARTWVAKAIPASKILPVLLGYPEKTDFLFLLQNKDELRPTGGFIGTYGIVQSDSGDFSRFETHDIYHIDMPIKDKLKIKPPAPIGQYLVPLWYMRDANWSPDYPASARQITWFYNMENSLHPKPDEIENFDGVIAITSDFITDLMQITGPIIVEGQEYNKDNFVELLEYRVEKGYVQLGISSWQRKEVIGEISKQLKTRLFDMDAENWIQIASVIDKNIAKKNILMYFFDPDLENLVIAENMGGEIKATQGDYFMVVDANLGALKTDAAMSKSIQYTVQQREDGLYALLKLNYAHGGRVDYRTGQYKSYTRAYVPAGSKLLKATGPFKFEPITAEDAGKTVFETFFTVDPGKIANIEYLYKLPENINQMGSQGRYVLYVQKQPGNNVEELTVDLQLANIIRSYKPLGLSSEKINSNQLRWTADLETDRSFEAMFKK